MSIRSLVFTPLSDRLFDSVTTAASWTGDTNETTLYTLSIPAGHGLTAGSRIIISTLWSVNNDSSAKTAKVKIGTTSYFSSSLASTAMCGREVVIILRSLTSQVCMPASNQTGYGTTSGTVTTGSEDVSGAFTITITGTLADGTDTITLECVSVRFELF